MAKGKKKSSTKKYVYYFGDGKAEGNGQMKDLLGGKGAGLAEMTNTGVPVPSGFTITTEVCNIFYKVGEKVPAEVTKQQLKYVEKLEKSMGAKLGDAKNPLLVSIRSGSKFSMPGMMDTILNLGLNDETVHALITKTKNERFAYDCYRRFIQMFGGVVLGMEKSDFEHILQHKKDELGIALDTDLKSEDLKDLLLRYKKAVKEHTGKEFPQDAYIQMDMARDAVFKS